MVSKEILSQYSSLRQEIEELRQKIKKNEQQIQRIEQDGRVCDKVKGGEGGIQSFKIEGFPHPQYEHQKTLLYSRKATLISLEIKLAEMLNEIEAFIASVKDSHMRRIINLRIIENLSWNEVADCIGGGNTEDSVRKAFSRFISEK